MTGTPKLNCWNGEYSPCRDNVRVQNAFAWWCPLWERRAPCYSCLLVRNVEAESSCTSQKRVTVGIWLWSIRCRISWHFSSSPIRRSNQVWSDIAKTQITSRQLCWNPFSDRESLIQVASMTGSLWWISNRQPWPTSNNKGRPLLYSTTKGEEKRTYLKSRSSFVHLSSEGGAFVESKSKEAACSRCLRHSTTATEGYELPVTSDSWIRLAAYPFSSFSDKTSIGMMERFLRNDDEPNNPTNDWYAVSTVNKNK